MRQSKDNIPEVQFENAVFLPEVVKLLNQGHTITLRLKGFSMRPFLEDNRDKALLVKAKEIAVGDPVLAEIHSKHFVMHRIISIKGDDVILLGDGNLTPEYCKKKDVVGSVVGFYRKGRNKMDRIDGKKWKIYSRIWVGLRPIRRYLLGFYRRIWIPILGTI